MSTDYAANAPEFFMHHGMLDSIWYRWQEKDHKCKYAYFPKNVSKLMDGHPFTTMDFIDSFNQGRCVKVKYDDWIAEKIKPGTNLGMNIFFIWQQGGLSLEHPNGWLLSLDQGC